MTRVRIFSKRFAVPAEAIDVQGHVSNLAYVGWMQDVAIEHSAVLGWPMRRYLELGAGWVVRSHFIEYLRPAFADERLSAHTWVPRFDQRSTPRRYLFVRDTDRTVLARAETIWVFVDLASGRRRPIPAELLDSFDPVPEDDEVHRVLGLGAAAPGDRGGAHTRRRTDIPMTDERFELEYEGRRYTVQRGESAETAAEGGGAPVGRLAWYITLGPKAITRLPTVPGESDEALRGRIRQWLAEHPEMPGSENIVLGGG